MFTVHVFCGFLLSYLLMSRAYYAWVHQDYQSIVFTWQDFTELAALFQYYLFLRADKPPVRKYNAGQRLFYTGWYIVLSLANISGALAYKESYFLPFARVLGGVHHLAWITLFGAFALTLTVPLHIYLAFTENMANLQAMVTGYSYILKPGSPHVTLPEVDKIQEKLPGKWLWRKLLSLRHKSPPN